ncbi:MAG: SpoIIE family protein phosphatase [Gammaproteobacteria bacterium]|nr:SpoIIE family protein phosphatase [Gammaproteobacteria bacterium]
MKILIVDDDELVRTFVRTILESAGYEVVEAENGKVAVDGFDEIQPDLILMDLIMPVMDGVEATHKIKEKSGDKYLPVVFVTGQSDDSTLVECLGSGGDDFIDKSVNADVLLAKIKAYQRSIEKHAKTSKKVESLKKITRKVNEGEVETKEIYSRVLNRSKIDSNCIRKSQQSSYSFNGDIVMSVKKPNTSISFLVGDFTGHGLPAAIFSMPVVDIFFQMSSKGFSAQEIIAEINDKIRGFLPVHLFFSVVIFDLDLQDRVLKVCNAGMPDVLLLSNEAKVKHLLKSQHLPLGLVRSDVLNLVQESIDLDEGDLIISYSDGLTNSLLVSSNKKAFGIQSILDAAVENSASVDTVDDIVEKLHAFAEDSEFEDDISLLTVKIDFDELNNATAKPDANMDRGDWKVTFRLEANMLKEKDPVATMLSSIGAMRSFDGFRERIQFLLTEMLSNAIEHGLLKLDSLVKKKENGFEEYYAEKKRRLAALTDGYVEVTFSFTHGNDVDETQQGMKQGVLRIEMEDSGDGFDVSRVVQNGSTSEVDTVFNRGVSLIGSLSENMTYNEKGNRVSVVVKDLPG